MKKAFRILLVFLVLLQFATIAFGAYKGQPLHIIFKGLNTKAGPLSLDNGESPQCLNVHTNIFGTLLKRKGYSKLNSSAPVHTGSNPAGNGLFDYAVDTITRKQVAFFGNTLNKMDALDGVWDTIHEADGITLSDDIVNFENFNGTLVWTNWSRDTLQSWDGSASSTTCVVAAPKGKYIIKAYTRAFIAGLSANPLRYHFSAVDDHTTWDLTNDFETLDAPSGDESRGFGLLKGRLYGFTKFTVNLISNQGGNPLFLSVKRLDGVGCGAPRSIQTVNVPTLGESMVWLTEDKRIVAWNGSTLKIVSDRISSDNGLSSVSMPLINFDVMEKSHAVIFEENGWYVLFVPLGSTIETGIIWDYKTDTLWAFSNQNFLSSTLLETSNGIIPYTLGNANGFAYRWFNGNDDDGAAINGTWDSRKWDFGSLPFLKKGQTVWVVTKTIGEIDLTFENRYDWNTSYENSTAFTMSDDEWVLGDVLPATLGGNEAKTHRVDIDRNFNSYQIRLSNNSTDAAFEVFSLDVVAANLGGVGEVSE